MHRYRQGNDYRQYSFLAPTTAQNNYYQLYRSRSENRPSISYTTSDFFQQYPTTTRISDLAEPLSVFDDVRFSRPRQPNPGPLAPVYERINTDRQVTLHATRFQTACAFRERLLIDIQQNITEIDQELSLLERRPIMSRPAPLRLTSMSQRAPPVYYPKRIQPRRPSRVYQVIPRIPDPPKKVIPRAKPTPIRQQPPAAVLLVHYHYGPEIEENEISKGDPENVDLESTVNELVDLTSHQAISLDPFRRVQSALPANRVSIFIPEYIDAPKVEEKKVEENSHEKISIVIDPPPSTLVEESTAFISAPELKAKIRSPSKASPTPIAVEPVEPKQTRLSKLFSPPTEPTVTKDESKLSRERTMTQPDTTKDAKSDDDPQPFVTFGTESVISDTFASIYQDASLYRTHSTLLIDSIDTNDISKLSNTTLLELKSTEADTTLDRTKDSKPAKKKKKKKKATMAKPVVTSITTYPSSMPASIVYNAADDSAPEKDPAK